MKQLLFLFLFLAFMVSIQAQTDFFVSHTSSTGSTVPPFGTGTQDDPWDLQTALTTGNNVGAGATIWLAGGQYNGRYTSTINGVPGNAITVTSKPGEWAVLNGNVPKYNDERDKGVLYLRPVSGSSNVHFKDFEITSLETVQTFSRDEDDDSNFIGYTGVNHVGGVDCKFINLIIHNMPGQGVGSWKPTGGTEFYGCVVYNNGVIDTNGTRQYEHGFYIQNNTDQIRKFRNNVVFNNFGKGMILWSSSQCGDVDEEAADGDVNPSACDFLKNALFDNNAVFNNGNISFAGQGGGRDNIEVATDDNSGQKVPKNVTISNNALYHNIDFETNCCGTQAVNNDVGGSLSFGKRGNTAVNNVSVTNNLIAGRGNALRFMSADSLEFKNNDVLGRFVYIAEDQFSNIQTGWDFDFNNYFTRNPSAFRFGFPGTLSNQDYFYWLDTSVCIPPANLPAGYWTEFNIGNNSTWGFPQFFAGEISNDNCDPIDFPSRDSIKVTQNEHNPNRYTVVVVNPSNADNVAFNFSSGVFFEGTGSNISPNTNYTLRDVENYGSPINGSIDGSFVVNFPMTLADFESPLDATGNSATLSDGTEKTPKNFGVFIIEFGGANCPAETTWNGTTWDNGNPDLSTKAIVDADYSVAAHGEFSTCSLEVTTNGSMTIQAGTTITVCNDVANLNVDDVANNDFAADKFLVEDDGSLVMINDTGTVSGKMTVEKKWAEHLFTPGGSPGIDSDKFSIWSTPVEEAGSLPKDFIFSFESIVFYFNGTTGLFEGISNGSLLTPGLGYYIRQNDGSDFDIDVPRQFEGTVNNGEINIPVEGSPADPKFYFFGNPYPSAIKWSNFVADNEALLSSDKAVYFWKQVNPSIAYEDQPPQWLVLNDSGSVPIGEGVTGTANEFISTAQGFTTEVAGTGEVVFKNSQRVAGNNDQFFDSQDNTGKMWLNLKTASTGFDQILLAFVDPVTSDAKYNSDGGGVELYSLDGDQQLVIQAIDALREQNVSILLGFSASQPGDYSFNIEQEFIDANFEIILEDTELNTFTNLRLGDYNFTTTEASSSDTRFRLNFNYVEPIDVSFTHEKPCDSFGTTLDFFYTGGTEGVTFLWDFGANASPQTSTDANPVGITFPEGDQSVTLTVFKNGQSQSLTEIVSVVDVGSSGSRKVIVCHNGENIITISVNALANHLSHGDCIGPCDEAGFVPVTEEFNTSEIELYPNPTSSQLFVRLNIDQDYEVLKIVDISGRVIQEIDIEQNVMQLDVSNLSKGLYFLSVQLESKLISVKKFIKN